MISRYARWSVKCFSWGGARFFVLNRMTSISRLLSEVELFSFNVAAITTEMEQGDNISVNQETFYIERLSYTYQSNLCFGNMFLEVLSSL
jgi:hypothetical protein